MVKIRLKRLGRKKRPFYRIVVMNDLDRREGAALAELGYYNPLSRELKLDKALAESWITKGAIPTETAARLIKQAGDTTDVVVLEKASKERLSKKAQDRLKQEADAKAAAEAEAKAAAEAAAAVAAAPAEEPAAEAEEVAAEA